MTLHNITRRELVEVYSYAHSFRWADDPDSGFSFDCLENGEIIDNPNSRENLWMCLFNLFERPVVYEGIVERYHSFWGPASGRCDCGRTVWLEHEYHGIDCGCGRIYSSSGQELAPRSQWEDRWDEDSTEPYNVEFGYV